MDAKDIVERSGLKIGVPDLDGDTYGAPALNALSVANGVPVIHFSRTGLPPRVFISHLRDLREDAIPEGYKLSPCFDVIVGASRVLGDKTIGQHFEQIRVRHWSLVPEKTARFHAQKGN